jgi:hypothetical protein
MASLDALAASLGGMFAGSILGMIVGYFVLTRPRRKKLNAYRDSTLHEKIEALKSIYHIERADPRIATQLPLYVIALLGVIGLFLVIELDPSGFYAGLFSFTFFFAFMVAAIYFLMLRYAIARLILLEHEAAAENGRGKAR